MPFCPKCRTEYVEGTENCEDCQIRLVAELPPEDSDDHSELLEVWHTSGEMEGQMIRSVLESNNIDSMLSGESLRLTHGFTIDGLAEVHVLVRKDDFKRACEIIGTLEGMRQCTSCGHPASEQDETCHYCNTALV